MEWFLSPSELLCKSLSFWFGFGLVVATAVTVFGVAGEYVVGDDKSARCVGIRLRGYELIVTIGVAAEMFTEGGAFWYSDRLQAIEENEISNATTTAAKANLRAANIEKVTAWRKIEPDDFAALVSELSKGKGEIDIAFAPSDPESEYFAIKIIGDAFVAVNNSSSSLKWRVNLYPWSSDSMYFGIAIPGPENEQVKLLRSAFSAAHIEYHTEDPPPITPPIRIGQGLNWTPPPKHDAFILVGLKRPPL